jgi:hypothetical protein
MCTTSCGCTTSRAPCLHPLCQVWVYGNSFKSVLVAVVVPKKAALTEWAAANGAGSACDDAAALARCAVLPTASTSGARGGRHVCRSKQPCTPHPVHLRLLKRPALVK